jgi:hypothetical protein
MEGVASSILPPTSRRKLRAKKMGENVRNGGKRLKQAKLSLIVFQQKTTAQDCVIWNCLLLLILFYILNFVPVLLS